MMPQPKTYQQFVEHHICLLQELSDSLEAGRAAIVSFRLQDFEESINDHKRLCVQISALNTEVRRAFPLAALNQSSVAIAGDLSRRLQQARERLQKLNTEQQALLLRSRRTVNAMLNGFRSFEGSYAAEARKQTSGGASLLERV